MSSPASTSTNPGPAVTQGHDSLGGGTPYRIGNSPTDKVGAYGVEPVVQPAGSGNTTTVAAGATTAVYTNTTFSGGIGTTAYTVGDLVAALKQLGFLA